MPLRLAFLGPVAAWLTRAYHGGMAGVTSALKEISQHTGIPVVVVAALALVLSYRAVRRATRLAGEVAIALALVLAATKLGWIHW
jgi:hypothetical protein